MAKSANQDFAFDIYPTQGTPKAGTESSANPMTKNRTPLLVSSFSAACILADDHHDNGAGAEPTSVATDGESPPSSEVGDTATGPDMNTDTADSEPGADDTSTGSGGEAPRTVVSMGLGGLRTCATFGDGNSLCWGVLGTGVIGDDEPASAGSPLPVDGILTIATGFSEGQEGDTCGLRSNGTIYCESHGRVVDLGAAVVGISTGFLHACLVLEAGGVRCWSSTTEASSGQLGTGDCFADDFDCIAHLDTAVDVDFGGQGVQVVAAGWSTCVLTELGTVRCWGENRLEPLGNMFEGEYLGDDEVPAVAADVELGGVVTQIAAGLRHRCALMQGGGVRCWGASGSGQLGHGDIETIGDDETPGSAGDIELGTLALEIVAGDAHTCALGDDGSVRCWGANESGQLGYGDCVADGRADGSCNIGDDESPASAGEVDVGGPVSRIFAGGSNTCAVLSAGGVRCWGSNTVGQLGHGDCQVDETVLDDPGCNIGDDETPSSAGDVPVE